MRRPNPRELVPRALVLCALTAALVAAAGCATSRSNSQADGSEAPPPNEQTAPAPDEASAPEQATNPTNTGPTTTEAQPPTNTEAQPVIADDDEPAGTPAYVPTADVTPVVEAVNGFSADLFASLAADLPEGNVLASPVSVATALNMTMAGAAGTTLDEMQDVLGAESNDAAYHEASGELLNALTGSLFAEVAIANRVWIENTWNERILDGFRETVSGAYGAGLAGADFVGAAESARAEINGWVAEITRDKIPELIPMGVITDLTRLVLTNAVYFNADWAEPFDTDRTVEGPFFAPTGEVTAELMFRMDELSYSETDAFQAVRLPYEGAEWDMLVLLPREGHAAGIEEDTSAAFAAAAAGLGSTRVALTLPKFTFRWNGSLVPTLRALGMDAAFGRSADFSAMADLSNTDGLYISDVVHEAFIEVDEEGTEAAAATAVIVATRAAVEQPRVVEMRCDRPFYFAIRHTDTGTLLFVGRLANPAE